MKNLKRRFFIKSSSLVAGGLVLPSFNINRMANSANNKKLKVSVVGCGGRGTGAAVQALRADENVELVAMADAFKDRIDSSLKAIQEHFDGEKKISVKEKNIVLVTIEKIGSKIDQKSTATRKWTEEKKEN